jgi:hypothetical protein
MGFSDSMEQQMRYEASPFYLSLFTGERLGAIAALPLSEEYPLGGMAFAKPVAMIGT